MFDPIPRGLFKMVGSSLEGRLSRRTTRPSFGFVEKSLRARKVRLISRELLSDASCAWLRLAGIVVVPRSKAGLETNNGKDWSNHVTPPQPF